MARLRVWKLDETDTDVVLAVMLEADDGKSHFGVRHVTLPKTANASQVQAAILQARMDIRDVPKGGVEDMAKDIVDRINSGDIP